MKSLLENADYVFNPELGIWSATDFEGLAYSDGDEVEKRIAHAVASVDDVSVLSTELRQHCIDWPSLYHLGSRRSNLMRPFEQLLSSAEILEIGAGCGAITRFLGEAGGKVLALEGSPRRAAIARSRTRDLENVTVISETFDDFKCNRQFDVVTLIGVLEYASRFTQGDHSHLRMLQRARQLLKPGGRLIIAIENQLGLKYFAGAPEDHLGQPMIGIENRYRSNQPQTFGRETLSQLLKAADFAHTEFLAPYPDYKLPISIVTEQGFIAPEFDVAALACLNVKRDPQMPILSHFSMELAYPTLIANKLGLEMANSFLVIATSKQIKNLERKTLAFHYSTDRVPEYCKETRFVLHGTVVEVEYKKLGIPAVQAEQKIINFSVPKSSKYIFGTLLSMKFMRIVVHDGWTYQQVAAFIHQYLEILQGFGAFSETTGIPTSAHFKIAGHFFDVIPQNIIFRPDGRSEIIDMEWATEAHIELGYLLFRSLISLINMMTRFGRPAHSEGVVTHFQFIDTVLKEVGIPLQESDYKHYVDIESEIQHTVAGCSKALCEDWGRNNQLSLHTLEQRITSLTDETVRLGVWVLGLDNELKEERAKMLALTTSYSWRITRPFREASQWVLSPKMQAKRYVKGALRLTKRMYQALPLSLGAKIKHRQWILKVFPRLLLLTSEAHSSTIPVLSMPRPITSSATNREADVHNCTQ